MISAAPMFRMGLAPKKRVQKRKGIAMKKGLQCLFLGKYFSVIIGAMIAVSVLFNYAFRFGYVYIDNVLFAGFSLTLFLIAVVDAVLLAVLASLRMRGSRVCAKKGVVVLQCLAELFAIVFTIIVVVNFLVSGEESIPVAMKLCKEILPLWSAVTGLVFALFILPYIGKKRVKQVCAACMTAIMVFVVYAALFPVGTFHFTATPAVFDNGAAYSVAFSTSDTGTAYLEYTYEGQDFKVYAADNGRKTNSTIHTIQVPYAHLSGNTYKVGATRVLDELSYGGRTGKTIESAPITFEDHFGETVQVLTVSDWHTLNEEAKATIARLGAYNAVILLGDSAPGLMFPEDVANYILAFAADVSRGEMPVLFARGNHETRGREAGNLSAYLGIENFYFTANLGDYHFVILDSGEDKADDHSEYGGMVAYEANRASMVDWLTQLEIPDNQKTIALSHAPEICIEEALSKTATNKLAALNVRLMVSGHLHRTEFFEDMYAFPVWIDGGKNANGKGTFVASKMTLSPDKIELRSMDSNGETTIQETVLWE